MDTPRRILAIAAALLVPAVASAQPAAGEGATEPSDGAVPKLYQWPADEAPPEPAPPSGAVTAPSEPAPSPYGSYGASAAVSGGDPHATARLAAYDEEHGGGDDDSDDDDDEAAEDREGYHRHDGFFMRLGLGVGVGGLYSTQDTRADVNQFTTSWIGHQSLAVGGCLVDNLAVYLDVQGFVDGGVPDPDDPVRLAGFIGVGVSYYFMPNNFHLSASVGPAAAALGQRHRRSGDRDYDYDNTVDQVDYFNGVGASLSLGKEWWVHDNWGVGLGATLLYAYTGGYARYDRDYQELFEAELPDLHSLAATFGLTATYN